MRTDRQQRWRRCIDTVLDLPDGCPWETAPVVTQATYVAQPRSVVLLALALEGSPGKRSRSGMISMTIHPLAGKPPPKDL